MTLWFRGSPALRHAIMIGQLLLVEQQVRSPNVRRDSGIATSRSRSFVNYFLHCIIN